MEVGTEEDWVEGILPEEDPPTAAPGVGGEEVLGDDVDPDFHSQFKALMTKHGVQDFFYVVRSADGKALLLTWGIDAQPEAEGYRARAAGLAFEVSGLLQHMEGSTWPQLPA